MIYIIENHQGEEGGASVDKKQRALSRLARLYTLLSLSFSLSLSLSLSLTYSAYHLAAGIALISNECPAL